MRRLFLAAALGWAAPCLAYQAPERHIGEWGACDAVDGHDALAAAIGAAKNGAFRLIIDCHVTARFGGDPAKAIFLDNDTDIEFTPDGLLSVDNSGVPAFAIINSSNVTLKGWRIAWSGQMPLSPPAAAGAFNDVVVKNWLTTNRAVTFSGKNPYWSGYVQYSAIFLLRGTAMNIAVSDMKVWATAATADKFVPMVFGMITGERSGITASAATPMDATNYAIPRGLAFTNIDFDGIYFGWQGNIRDALFSSIRAHRYGDLQDAAGGTLGGVNHGFPPPHLFYLNFDPNGPADLIGQNITLTDVIDDGIRIGAGPRDPGPTATLGDARSLKIGGKNVLVDGYRSYRPDGFLDLLSANGLEIRNVDVSYDSAWLNGLYPAIRFPGPFGSTMPGLINVSIHDVSIRDLAALTAMVPVGPSNWSANNGLKVSASSTLNAWGAPDMSALSNASAGYGGTAPSIDLIFSVLYPNKERGMIESKK